MMDLGGRDLEGPNEGQQEGSEETSLAGADRTQQRDNWSCDATSGKAEKLQPADPSP